jgi:adenine deaminase
MTIITGHIIDIRNRRTYSGKIHIENGIVTRVSEEAIDRSEHQPYLLPGFTDAHIHIESSMLVPYEFARLALPQGTVAAVSDPHEIANVCGLEGIYYMLNNAKEARLKFHFGAPSCVPATSFETAGASLGPDSVELLLKRDDIFYLSEMMNYPGVLHRDPEVMAKIAIAHKYNRPVDGHAPGLMGEDAQRYIAAGISTDHECFTLEEAIGKLKHGMKILIREGSAARNFEALHPLLKSHPSQCMFCCDDKHPDELMEGHINQHVKRALALGYDLYDVLQVACVNAVEHYRLPVGLLREGDPADFILIDHPDSFTILETWINGEKVFDGKKCILPAKTHDIINHFHAWELLPGDLEVKAEGKQLRIIEARDGQLITGELQEDASVKDGYAIADTGRDLLKIAVVNRYEKTAPSVAFIRNFGLKRGAIASSVAHDSHNIIVVGADDRSMARAVNLIMQNRGGLSLVDQSTEMTVPLPVAGLMSTEDGATIGKAYKEIDRKAKDLGSGLRAPYMSLSFMALLVIPQLKISDKGLFDGGGFRFTQLFIS